jgi:parallel beta-helix repeat protein
MIYSSGQMTTLKSWHVIICHLALGLQIFQCSAVAAKDLYAENSQQLRLLLTNAKADDRIIVMPGNYDLERLTVRRGGEPNAPITVTALIPGQARIRSGSVELFKIAVPYWIFENLDIVGDDSTEHAFHIVADAHHTILRGNRLLNFHAAIKANPEHGKKPNHVIVENNVIYNEAVRQTSAPVTSINVDVADAWVVRENFIADFAKAFDNQISYGAFFKGGNRNGVFERNLIVCEWKHSGGRRVGLSFGGGGMFACPGPACRTEHIDGIMRNNIVMNCTQAPGIYLNRAAGSQILNNTIINSYGIMARFPGKGNYAVNNIASGAITAREGAEIISENNLETGLGIGTFIPGAAVKLKHRISDYHIKFPNLLDEGDIRRAQDVIDKAANWLGASFVGRGSSGIKDWFAAPEIGDFSLIDGRAILKQGSPRYELSEDFCGQQRGTEAPDLGAIAYSVGSCDPNEFVVRLLSSFAGP